MRGVVAIAYAVISYVLFLASFLYLIAFVGNMMVPCTIDNGLPAPTLEALVVDGVSLSLFLAVHSVMARTWFQVLVDPVCVAGNRTQYLCAGVDIASAKAQELRRIAKEAQQFSEQQDQSCTKPWPLSRIAAVASFNGATDENCPLGRLHHPTHVCVPWSAPDLKGRDHRMTFAAHGHTDNNTRIHIGHHQHVCGVVLIVANHVGTIP